MAAREHIKGEDAAKRLLRQEVAFGCPICRNPFLEFHHFDPPWRVRHHFDPQGVIALCRDHHAQAEGGHFTKKKLRELKASSYSVSDIKERFPWARTDYLVRIGGSFTRGCRAEISVDKEPVVWISTGDDGLLMVSFVLRCSDGQIVARMTNNVFEVGPRPPSELKTTASANRIKIWHEAHNIAIDVSLRQLTAGEFDTKLTADRDRPAQVRAQAIEETEERFQHLSREMNVDIKKHVDEMKPTRSPEVIAERVARHRQRFGVSGMPDHMLEAHFSGDPVGHLVSGWAASAIDDDGLISFLDFENLSLYGKNRHIRIRDGIGDGVAYNAVVNCDTAIAL